MLLLNTEPVASEINNICSGVSILFLECAWTEDMSDEDSRLEIEILRSRLVRIPLVYERRACHSTERGHELGVELLTQ